MSAASPTDYESAGEVTFAAVGISNRVRTFYRDLRRRGFSRRDVDLLTMGMVIGTGDGIVAFASTGRPLSELLDTRRVTAATSPAGDPAPAVGEATAVPQARKGQ